MTLAVAYVGADGFGTSVETDRQVIAAMFGSATVKLVPGSFNLTPAAPGAGLTATVAAGKMAIAGDDQSTQGSYLVWSVASEDVPWVVPDVLPRIDSLLLVIADGQYGALSGDQGPKFVVATGVPNGSPVALSDSEIETDWAEPGAWVRLANVAVSPGDASFVSGDITNLSIPTSGVSSAGIKVLFREMSQIWPVDGTSYITTAETLIGGGAVGLAHTFQLKKTFTVEANRCYEVMAWGLADGDSGSTAASSAAQCTLRYASGASVSSSSSLFGADRAIAHSDTNTDNGGFQAIGHLNGLAAGQYTIGAFLKSFDAADGVRVFAPWGMSIKDVGPSIAEG